MEEIKRRVQNWWNNSPCCSKATNAIWGSKEFFEQVDLYKDTYEPFTDKIADYAHWKEKKILEIGVGLGKDFSRFAANGALATGIDLSDKSLSLTKKRLEIFNLKGNLCLADAENLPFKDNVFDMIFSWGVLHHTPNTEKAINELYRCLKQGGSAIIMFYNKYSLVILLLYHITKIRTQLISLFGLSLLLGIKKLLLPWLWFKKMKNKLMKPERWDPNNLLAAFTDGVGNPLSKVYSRNQARRLFSKFKNIKICAHECKNSCYLKMLQLFSSLEKYFGFFMVIEAEK